MCTSTRIHTRARTCIQLLAKYMYVQCIIQVYLYVPHAQASPMSQRVYSHLMYFSKHDDEEVQLKAVNGLGRLIAIYLQTVWVHVCCYPLSDPSAKVTAQENKLIPLE